MSSRKLRLSGRDGWLTLALMIDCYTRELLGWHLSRSGKATTAEAAQEQALTQRDPEMHQTRKGNQWYFGMKMHIGVDESLGLIHSLETTPANEADINVTDKLLHGAEKNVWGDAGYQGVEKREEHKSREVNWFVAMRPGKRALLPASNPIAQAEKAKAQTRAKVEHPFRYMKLMFGYGKVRYRGLAKNNNRLHVLRGLQIY